MSKTRKYPAADEKALILKRYLIEKVPGVSRGLHWFEERNAHECGYYVSPYSSLRSH